MTPVSLTDDQLRLVMTIAEQIPYDLRDIYLKTLAAHLRRSTTMAPS
jgi:hypothetical protein